MNAVNPQSQLGMAANQQGVDLNSLLQMVQQVESLPPEVLDLVMHRKQESEKANKQSMKESNSQMDNLLNAAKQLGISQPVQAPTPESQSGSVGQILSGILGNVNPNLMV